MSIILRLDRVMADRKMSLNELSDRVGVSNVNLSKLKTGKVSAIRFSTLNAICKVLNCQPGDILEFIDDGKGVEGLRIIAWILLLYIILACLLLFFSLYDIMNAEHSL